MSRPNWKDQTIWTGDCLDIMRGMNSCSVDLIYLDPPFNSNANYAAPIGSKSAGAEFKDTWSLSDVNLAWHGQIKTDCPALYALLDAVRKVHSDSMMSYLIYIGIRVMEMQRILKANGSIYLHCDPTASHYLKWLMDAVFGKNNFRNELVWYYKNASRGKKVHAKAHDVIFWYAFNDFKFNRDKILQPYESGMTAWRYHKKGLPPPAGKTPDDVIVIPALNTMDKERTGYPTQKPRALLERIIVTSSDEGDMVLDPFCGCATTCVAAARLQRKWAGIDVSPKAADLVRSRLDVEISLLYKGPHRGYKGSHRADIPQRTDLGKIPKYNGKKNKQYLYGEQGGYCNLCEVHFEPRHLEVDHIISLAKGGTDHISNLQLLCGSCNRVKGTLSNEQALARLIDKKFIAHKNST